MTFIFLISNFLKHKRRVCETLQRCIFKYEALCHSRSSNLRKTTYYIFFKIRLFSILLPKCIPNFCILFIIYCKSISLEYSYDSTIIILNRNRLKKKLRLLQIFILYKLLLCLSLNLRLHIIVVFFINQILTSLIQFY